MSLPLLNFATTVSNLTALPLLILLFQHKLWLLAIIFSCSMLSSMAFHMCETTSNVINHNMPGLIQAPLNVQSALLITDEVFAILSILLTLPRWRYIIYVRSNLILAIFALICGLSELIPNTIAYTIIHSIWHITIFIVGYLVYSMWLQDTSTNYNRF